MIICIRQELFTTQKMIRSTDTIRVSFSFFCARLHFSKLSNVGKSQSFVADLQRWLFQSNLMKCKMVYLLYPPMPNPWRWLEILDIVGSSIVFENYIQYQTLWRNVTFLGFDLSFFTTVYTIDMFLLRLFFPEFFT